MLPPLRQSLAAAASSSAGLRRCVSTASAHPPWAIIEDVRFIDSPAPRAFLEVAEPSSLSNLLVPVHFINPKPRIGSDHASLGILDARIRSASGDGHFLLQFEDGPATAADAAKARAAPEGQLFRIEIDPDITRCVCNPLSGEMFRLPDIDGTKKVRRWHAQGLLTQSDRGDGPPDRFAVAELSVQGEGNERSFVMRRFFSETGEWDKLVGLPSPLPRPRRMDIDHDVLAFAGRLWWLDLTWGAVCADPFSDRPELCFVELPWGSVRPVPGPGPWTKYPPAQGTYRRMGVSEGKLRYVEVSQKEPFILSSFTLDDDYSGWMLEHQVALSRVWADAGKQEGTPRIGVIDPLNAHAICVIIDVQVH
ncbi:hypothetical protein QOZ80_5BG0417560 [Eleusine coracana subsp. coracana]|nr:hypothetical protein QOZ80_5BG0417560 [Eleusine coracana subsp. coracana]